MLKDIVTALGVAGIAVPKWFGILMLISAIIVGGYLLIKKSFVPWIKRMAKIQNDIASIPKIKEKSIQADKDLKEQISKVDTNMTQKVNETNSRIDTVKSKVDNIETKLDLIVDGLSKLQSSLSLNETSQAAQAEGLKMMLCNELDKRYRRYLELGYIPDSEFDEYVDMHSAYNALKGNHSGDAKFNYVMEHLDRKI